jgi:predicted tellurium resistance membrane protein TerC
VTSDAAIHRGFSSHDGIIDQPEAWAALLTDGAGNVLGIDTSFFLSVIVSRLPEPQAKRARQIGLALALVFASCRSVCCADRFDAARLHREELGFSWRAYLSRRLFLIAKATHEIHPEMEAREDTRGRAGAQRVLSIVQDHHHLVFAGSHHHRDRHAGTRDHDRGGHYRRDRDVCIGRSGHEVRGGTSDHLALAFLVLIGLALRRRFQFHIPRGYIYCDLSSVAVEFSQCSRQEQPKKTAKKNIEKPVRQGGG